MLSDKYAYSTYWQFFDDDLTNSWKWQRSVLNEHLLLVLHHVTTCNELEWIHAEKQVVLQGAFMEGFLDNGLMKWEFCMNLDIE